MLNTLVDLLQPSGDCLEIRLGATASSYLCTFPLKSHRSIEASTHAALEGVFDSILINSASSSPLAAQPILQQSKKLFALIEETFPQLPTLRYSDQEIDQLCQMNAPSERSALPRFFSELKQRGQISAAQCERALQKISLEPEEILPFFQNDADLIFAILTCCLTKHMRKGSRLICCLADSAYEDPRFFDQIITDPAFDVKESALGEKWALLVEKQSS